MERRGIEPPSAHCERAVLPLNDLPGRTVSVGTLRLMHLLSTLGQCREDILSKEARHVQPALLGGCKTLSVRLFPAEAFFAESAFLFRAEAGFLLLGGGFREGGSAVAAGAGECL